MSLELVGFVILSAGLLSTASAVLIARNPIHSALFLILSFFFLAGLYLQLNANFVAIIQVLVYAGAIMVLFLFVIMLLNLSERELGEETITVHKVLGGVATLGLAGVLIWAIHGAEQRYLSDPTHMRADALERIHQKMGLGTELHQDLLTLAAPRMGLTTQDVQARLGAKNEASLHRRLSFYKALTIDAKALESTNSAERTAACKSLGRHFEAIDRVRVKALPDGNVGAGKCAGSDLYCEALQEVLTTYRTGACDASPLDVGFVSDMKSVAKATTEGKGAAEHKFENFAPQLASLVNALGATKFLRSSSTGGASLSIDEPRALEFVSTLIEMRLLTTQKLRFEHGNGNARLEACLVLTRAFPEMPASLCKALQGDHQGRAQRVSACFALDATKRAPGDALQCSSAKAGPGLEKALREMVTMEPSRAYAVHICNASPLPGQTPCECKLELVMTTETFGCETLQQRQVVDATLVMDARIGVMDERLASLEAALDSVPHPSSWRGRDAERIVGAKPSREEQAVIDALGEIFAVRLDHATKQVASKLDPGTYVNVPETSRRVVQFDAASISSAFDGYQPGGVFERARRGANVLIEQHRFTGGSEDVIKGLIAKRDALEKAYRMQVVELLRAMRTNQPQRAARLIRGAEMALLADPNRLRLGDNARDYVHTTLAKLSSGMSPAKAQIFSPPAVYDDEDFGSVKAVGRELFTTWLLPFEATSVLLLAGILGAVVIAKRRV